MITLTLYLITYSQAEYKGREAYKAGTFCDRCDVEPCEPGFFRAKCRAGIGALCEPCTNGIPAGATYLAPGSPVHVDFCAWTCTGIYERRENQCVISRITLIVVIVAGSGLSLFCICVIAYNSVVRTVRMPRRALSRMPQRSHVLVSLSASRDGRASARSEERTNVGGLEAPSDRGSEVEDEEASFHV